MSLFVLKKVFINISNFFGIRNNSQGKFGVTILLFLVASMTANAEKISDFGAFCTLEEGLTTLLHNSELDWSKKNTSAKKMLKVGQELQCVIQDIDKDKRRVAISHRLTLDNPFEIFETKYPVGTIVEGEVVNKNEYSLFVKIEDLDVDAFLHCNDLTYLNLSLIHI